MTETFPLYERKKTGEAVRFEEPTASKFGVPVIEIFGETQELMKKHGVNSYFRCDGVKTLGSEIQSMILLNQVLRNRGYRTLTYDEAMQLGKDFLPDNLYADLGIAVYETPGVNEEIGKILRPEISRRGLEYPILAHPSSLDFKGNVKFGEDDSLIIHGERAVEELRRFNFVDSSGVRGLCRDWDGSFDADWDDLFDSDEDGRVPFVVTRSRA